MNSKYHLEGVKPINLTKANGLTERQVQEMTAGQILKMFFDTQIRYGAKLIRTPQS